MEGRPIDASESPPRVFIGLDNYINYPINSNFIITDDKVKTLASKIEEDDIKYARLYDGYPTFDVTRLQNNTDYSEIARSYLQDRVDRMKE